MFSCAGSGTIKERASVYNSTCDGKLPVIMDEQHGNSGGAFVILVS